MSAKLSKSQIDRLGERLKAASHSEADLRLLDEYRLSFGDAYQAVIEKIRQLDLAPIFQLNLTIMRRPAKSTSSIIEKLRRERMRLSRMQDIAGCRVIVADILEQEIVVAYLNLVSSTSDVKTIDRRSRPSYGYRAVHFIDNSFGKLVEIQIRTELQHRWAEYSEKLSDVFDPAIKYGGGGDAFRHHLADFSKKIADCEKTAFDSTKEILNIKMIEEAVESAKKSWQEQQELHETEQAELSQSIVASFNNILIQRRKDIENLRKMNANEMVSISEFLKNMISHLDGMEGKKL